MSVQSFRDLVAWRRGMDVVVATYEITRAWPKEETFGLTSQVHRAVVSVVANIAEGQGRSGPREFAHHLSIADGSLAEVETLLLVAGQLSYLDHSTLTRMVDQINSVRRPLRGLLQRLR